MSGGDLGLRGAQAQRVAAWQTELTELLGKPDASAKVAAHIASLEGLGLDATTTAQVLAAALIGTTSAPTAKHVDSGGLGAVAQKLGAGILDAIRHARTKNESLKGVVAERTQLARRLDDIARGPLAQTIVEHLLASSAGEFSAVVLAKGEGRIESLLLTSTGRFLSTFDGDFHMLYGSPSLRDLHQLGVTPESLDAALLGVVRQIANGETIDTHHLRDLSMLRRVQKNPGPLEPLPEPHFEPTDAMRGRAQQAADIERTRIRSMADAKIVFEQLGHLAAHDEGVAVIRDHLRREHGPGFGFEVARGIVLTAEGFQRMETSRSDTYTKKGLIYKDVTTRFGRLDADGVRELRTTTREIDEGLATMLGALRDHEAGRPGALSWMVQEVGTKPDLLGP